MKLLGKLKALLPEDPRGDARFVAKFRAQQQALREFKRHDMRAAPDDGRGAGGIGHWTWSCRSLPTSCWLDCDSYDGLDRNMPGCRSPCAPIGPHGAGPGPGHDNRVIDRSHQGKTGCRAPAAHPG